MRDAAKRRWRFRLIELAVVIGVLAVLFAMLASWLQRSRESGRRVQCANALRQIGLALLNYEYNCKTFPPGMICDKGEDPAWTNVFRPNWAILSSPFRDSMPLWRSFDYAVPISHEGNRRGRGELLLWLLCPADSGNNRRPFAGVSGAEGDNWARGNYAVNAGNVFLGKDGVVDASSAQWRDNFRRGVMAVNDATMDLAGIRDGQSNTILLGEIRSGVSEKDRRGVWAMGMAGSSIACAHGSWGDDNGPNACNPWADDIKGADLIELGPAAADQCMDAWGGSGSRQATFRSLHPGGCNVAMADWSVLFVSDDIETSGAWGDAGADFWPLWDRLICSADQHRIDPSTLFDMPMDLVKVAGRVTYTDGTVPDGQHVWIHFEPIRDEDGRSLVNSEADGHIAADGRFELHTFMRGEGALRGRYRVTARSPRSKDYADVPTTPSQVTIDGPRDDLELVLER